MFDFGNDDCNIDIQKVCAAASKLKLVKSVSSPDY